MQEIDIRKVPSLISRDASTAIKGLLMLLIVFGHINLLTTDFATGNKTFIWHWLYTFHVYVFLILPFIYGYNKRSGVSEKQTEKCIDLHQVIIDLKHNLIKIGVPYCWFFLFSAIVFVIIGGGRFDLKGMLYAFFFGNEPLLDKYIGFNFMWFLPAMLALTTLKSIYYNSNKTTKIVIISISIVLWLLTIFKVISQSKVGMYVPFAISQAFYFIVLGLVSRHIVEKKRPIYYRLPVILILISGLTMLGYYYNTHLISIWTTLRLAMPILMFLLLYNICDILIQSKLLMFIGSYSLQIYLVHVFVINAFELFFSRFVKQSIGLGIFIYVLALGFSCGLALVMVKIPFFKTLLFPVDNRHRK